LKRSHKNKKGKTVGNLEKRDQDENRPGRWSSEAKGGKKLSEKEGGKKSVGKNGTGFLWGTLRED